MDLSVVICSWNNRVFLERCLPSLEHYLADVDHEVIVVDNGSCDGTAEMVRRRWTRVRLIRNRRNLGVAPARNQGLRAAHGRYLLILDSDTEFCMGGFGRLLEYLERNPQVGVLGARQVRFDGSAYPSARTFPGIRQVLGRRLAGRVPVLGSRWVQAHHVGDAPARGPVEVMFVIGAFQLFSARVLKDVGLLDERMFYGFEDADFCARAIKCGYRIVYYPDYTIRHYVQEATRRRLLSRKGLKLGLGNLRSYMRFYLRHHDLARGHQRALIRATGH